MSNWQFTNDKLTLSNGDVTFTMIKVPGADFYMGETVVTQELWESVMGSNPSEKKIYPNYAVESVSFYMVEEFIGRLNEFTSLEFRLPTVKEWMFAARGGSKSKGYIYPGSNNLDDVCSYKCIRKPVKSKLPNEIGLYDMVGCVLEWCSDPIGNSGSSMGGSSLHEDTVIGHRLKGGSFMNGKNTNTIQMEKCFSSGYKNFHIGFRLALSSGLVTSKGK